jgi:hypothetical protein
MEGRREKKAEKHKVEKQKAESRKVARAYFESPT